MRKDEKNGQKAEVAKINEENQSVY
jgi:hypothetical protein